MQKGKTPNLQIKEGNINGKQKSKICFAHKPVPA